MVEKKNIKITVSSMQLDNIVAELAKCSKNKANEIIAQERVLVNFIPATEQTKEIKLEDKIILLK